MGKVKVHRFDPEGASDGDVPTYDAAAGVYAPAPGGGGGGGSGTPEVRYTSTPPTAATAPPVGLVFIDAAGTGINPDGSRP